MSLEIKDTSVITRGEGWLSAWVGEEHVMMSAETGTCISLSESGGRIWELMEHPISLKELCQNLSDEYNVDDDALQRDVVTFLDTMQKHQAVKIQ